MIVIVIATIWMVPLVLIIGACRAARLGDQTEEQISSPALNPVKESPKL